MNNTLSGYILNMGFMLIILLILKLRASSVIKQKKSRIKCFLLFCITSVYIIADVAFIVCHFSTNLPPIVWQIVSLIFYVVYVFLPFVWRLFVRNFVGNTFSSLGKKLEIIPLIILLTMVAITPFTGFLYSITDDGMYVRGPGYIIFSWLNYFYYIEPFYDLIVIFIKKKEKQEPYIFHSIFISLIPLIGAVVNSNFIPVGTIFPFQPFCSIIVALLAFFFIASKDSDLLKDQHQEAIQKALEKAEEASRVKTRFLSDMSHDIRTPMNAIINLTDLALKENDINVVHEYLSRTEIASNFLLGLINDILDMSKIESDEIILHKENLTRTEFLDMIETVINPLVEKKHIHFHTELNPGKYTIRVDKLRFNQIFFNLLSNAAKYTPEGGDVWLEVHNMEVENNRLKIKFIVRDNGIGMSEDFLNHLFEPFAREETDFNIKTQGTGLGLSIVKRLVDKMDGTITVKSKLGEGSEFTVIFYVDIVSRTEVLQSQEKSNSTLDLKKGLRILLIEDNELNSYVTKIILEKADCVVTCVNNGKKAVELFTQSEPFSFDAIFTDLRMPVMGGIEATKIIRSSNKPDAKTIPIIAMTADVFEDDRKETLKAGINYHLSKPVDAKMIYKVLRECTPPPRKFHLK